MAKLYSSDSVDSLIHRLETLKNHESKSLEFEKQLSVEGNSSTIVREVNIHAYESIIEMIKEHFEKADTVKQTRSPRNPSLPRSTSGRKPGRPRKNENAEVAAANEE
ncbi:hypothetical protein [Paenibacillus humicus]|uniref:hypothetical protein n=1 Tax=Paenibacillus humicus TaxID=412861 RepID=UPI000FD99836|nr:hypothetical protein [Paenibacillus humicus]